MCTLSISIVTFAPSLNTLTKALKSLTLSLHHAQDRNLLHDAQIVLVDNGPGLHWTTKLTDLTGAVCSPHFSTSILSGHGNIGFGAAHNLAISSSQSDYHLIMNPDVILSKEAITNCLEFMKKNREIGALSPYAEDGAGNRQFLCKRFPTVFDLFLRGIPINNRIKIFKNRLARYEMQDVCCGNENIVDGIQIISGCFMFLRREKLEKTGGFSEKYFLYFEDFDLSLKLAEITKLAYVPDVKIVHYGGNAGKKGLKHILMFSKSACIFFREHGWKFV